MYYYEISEHYAAQEAFNNLSDEDKDKLGNYLCVEEYKYFQTDINKILEFRNLKHERDTVKSQLHDIECKIKLLKGLDPCDPEWIFES